MKKTLKQQLDEARKEIDEERGRRWDAEKRQSTAESEAKNAEQERLSAERSLEQLRTALNGANGHIAGMREVLIGIGALKEPKVAEDKLCHRCHSVMGPLPTSPFTNY
jgi:chromosome segregation ATPase